MYARFSCPSASFLWKVEMSLLPSATQSIAFLSPVDEFLELFGVDGALVDGPALVKVLEEDDLAVLGALLLHRRRVRRDGARVVLEVAHRRLVLAGRLGVL